MNDTTDAADGADADGTQNDVDAEVDDVDGGQAEANGGEEAEQAGGAADDGRESDDDDPTLVLAAEALEGLTETVEMLGGTAKEESRARLAELAEELRVVSEQLATAAGAGEAAEQETATTAKPAKPANDAKTGEGKADDTLTTTIGAVRATLQQVGNLLRANPSTTDDKPDEAKPTTGPEGEADQDTRAKDKTQKPTADDASSKLGAQLEALTAELRTLNTTVKAQQQRLAQLEKRSGLPNSRSAGEQPAKSQNDDDVGWPLDMNRSLDRESVDKSTSFHDV